MNYYTGNYDFSTEVNLYDLRTLENVPSANIPTHFTENEHFLSPGPNSLLLATANDFENGHEAWVPDQISLDRRWYNQFMYSY